MSKSFKVGDRVAFDVHWTGTVDSTAGAVEAFLESKQEVKTLRGVITAIKNGAAQVRTKEFGHKGTPLRNLRRLKPKAERRRVWATQHRRNGLWSVLYTEPPCSLQIDKDWEIVEFIEVRKKGGAQ